MDINPISFWYKKNLVDINGGFNPLNSKSTEKRKLINLEPWDNVRRDMFYLLLKNIEDNNIPGCFAELGVYQGSTAKLIHHYSPYRELYLFDTFDGFTEKGIKFENEKTGNIYLSKQFSDTSQAAVINYLKPQNNNIRICPGFFPESLEEDHFSLSFAFVHIDADLYQPIYDGLEFFYPLLNNGGIILVHDYHAWPGAFKAVNDFSKKYKLSFVPMPDKSGSVVFIKNEK